MHTTIKKKIEGIQKLGIASSLQPNFLENMAEYFSTEEN
jgi:predicted amidohydrolase YtcJ